MPDDPNNPPAGAPAGQPASGSATPAVEAPNKAGDAERQSLRERAIAAEREVEALKAAAKTAADAKLAEQGNYQALAKSKETEAGEWKAKYEKSQRTSALVAAGSKAGANDPSDLAAFVDLSAIDASDDHALRGAADKALADLKASKPYLFGQPNGKSGAPFPTPAANPGGGSEVKIPAGLKAGDVQNLTREQKQALVNGARGSSDQQAGGFFRK